MALSPARYPGRIVASTTMESTIEQLINIRVDMDIIWEHRYDNRNELVAYINDIQYSQNEILEQLDNLHCNHCRTNDHLQNLEAQVEHIDFQMHDCVGYLHLPLYSLPTPLLDMFLSVLVTFLSFLSMVWLQSLSEIKNVKTHRWHPPPPISTSPVEMRKKGSLRHFW